MIVPTHKGAGNVLCFLLFPIIQANAVCCPIYRADHQIPREALPIGNTRNQSFDCRLFQLCIHFFAIGCFCNVRRGRRTNKDNFLDLGLFAQFRRLFYTAVFQLPLERIVPIFYIGKQLRALQFLIVPDGQPARCSRIQNHDRRLGIVLQLVLIPQNGPVKLPCNFFLGIRRQPFCIFLKIVPIIAC